jgi:UDP-glucose 4-epimerase
MSRFLVTGGCGFIGSHLADRLVARGHQVRILDNLSSGRRENAPEEAELVIGDVTDSDIVADCVAGTDGIFHLAAIASVSRCHHDWADCHAVNLTGCIKVLEAARLPKRGPIPVVYASSAAVYGDCPSIPLTELDIPRPINAYGADKLGCELHARVATLAHGIPTIGLRLFNVYGPRQDPASPYSGVISIFADRLRRRQPVDIYGDGDQVRDFIFVDDVVSAFVAALSARQGIGEAFNVCTGQGTTIRELAGLMGEICGIAPDIRFRPPRPGDIRASIGDPARARRMLGCAAETSIRDGLTQTIAAISAAAKELGQKSPA